MCDLNKIHGLITAASIAIGIAAGLFIGAAIAAGSFYGALGNSVLMGGAAIAIGSALVSINLAIGSLGPCVRPPCTALADTIQTALVGMAVALTVLLAAVIVAIFAAAVPWAGTAVAIALSVGAVALLITLAIVMFNLNRFDMCFGFPTTSAIVIVTFVAGIIAMGGVGTALGIPPFLPL